MSAESPARRTLLRWLGRKVDDQQLDEELRSYVDLAVDHERSFGVSTDDARRRVMLQMGSIASVKDAVRDVSAGAMLDRIIRDIRHAIRSFRRSPGFTITAVTTLALGLGATLAIFSVINAALLRPIDGVRDANALVTLTRSQRTTQYGNFGVPDFIDYRRQAHTLTDLTAHRIASLTLGDTGATRVTADVVSGNYFAALGASVQLGRALQPSDDGAPGTGAVAVISDDLWRARFAAAEDIIGRRIMLNRYPFVVVGVASPRFHGLILNQPVDAWVPLSMTSQAIRTMTPTIMDDRAAGWLSLVGRLRPGATAEQAQAELSTIASGLAAAYPVTNVGRGVLVTAGVGFNPIDLPGVARLLGMMSGAVALVLAIACVNVAGLLMVRSSVRRRETAARLALGASRARLIPQLLIEGLLLSLLATVAAAVIAIAVTRAAVALQPPGTLLFRIHPVLDGRVFAFALGCGALVGTVLSIMPALAVSSTSPMTALKQGGAGAGTRWFPAHRSMVVVQVAASFFLLAAAGAVLLAMHRAIRADPGFRAEHVMTASVDLPAQSISDSDGVRFYRALLRNLRGSPGVIAASMAKTVPPRDWSDGTTIYHPGEEPVGADFRARREVSGMRVDADRIAPTYFATMGMTMIRGREFTDADNADAPLVAVVSQRLARAFWPGKDPIGQILVWPDEPDNMHRALRVVGVVGDARYRTLTDDAPLLLYIPVLQQYDGRATIVVRSNLPTAQLTQIIRAAAHTADARVPLYTLRTLSSQMNASLWQQQILSRWISAFGVLAVTLAGVGLYGAMSQMVVRRTRELSVRMALGASPVSVIGLVLRSAGVLVIAGLCIGLAVLVAAQPLLRNLVAGYRNLDPALVGAAAVGLLLLMCTACAIPARRAAGMHPAEALRCD